MFNVSKMKLPPFGSPSVRLFLLQAIFVNKWTFEPTQAKPRASSDVLTIWSLFISQVGLSPFCFTLGQARPTRWFPAAPASSPVEREHLYLVTSAQLPGFTLIGPSVHSTTNSCIQGQDYTKWQLDFMYSHLGG